jgi:exodeoxyribonuclease VII small subunit
MTVKKQSFEDSVARLEKIVEEMESGSLNLEDMIAKFEEGQKLLQFCSKRLNEVEKKVEVLVKKGDKTVSEDLDEEQPTEDGELF